MRQACPLSSSPATADCSSPRRSWSGSLPDGVAGKVNNLNVFVRNCTFVNGPNTTICGLLKGSLTVDNCAFINNRVTTMDVRGPDPNAITKVNFRSQHFPFGNGNEYDRYYDFFSIHVLQPLSMAEGSRRLRCCSRMRSADTKITASNLFEWGWPVRSPSFYI